MCTHMHTHQMEGVNVDSLVTSILDITLISSDLLHFLEREETIATAFLSVAPRLKETYGNYCKNHDNSVATLEKVPHSHVCGVCLANSRLQLLEDPQVLVSIANQMGTTRYVINMFKV